MILYKLYIPYVFIWQSFCYKHFRIHSAVLLTMVFLPYMTSLGPTYHITDSLHLWPPSLVSPPPPLWQPQKHLESRKYLSFKLSSD